MTATWDDRLISRDRAYRTVGEWPVYFAPGGDAKIFTRCGQCGQSCGLYYVDGRITPDGWVAAVLRHMVMAHDVPLSGIGRTDGAGRDRLSAEAGQDPDRGRAAGGGGGAGRAGHRPADQEAGHRRVGQAEEGGRG